jgi:hypothetical protein
MKKIIASILMLLYITVSGGVVLNVHYCMGEISSVEIDGFNDIDHCKKCGMAEASTSCCRTEFEVVKVDNVHKATVAVSNIEMPVAHLPVSVSLIDVSKLISHKIEHTVAHTPPIDISPDLTVLNCVFRI